MACDLIELYSLAPRLYPNLFEGMPERYVLDIVGDFKTSDGGFYRHAPDFWLNENFAEFCRKVKNAESENSLV